MAGELATAVSTGLSFIPGLGAGAGFIGGLLNNALGGTKRERIEDPITTEALKRLTATRDSITNINPEANRRMTDMGLAQQQGAAVQNAISASTANLTNQGVGGDIAAPMQSAVANSTAAVGAAGQFAGARVQNNQAAMQAELQRTQQLELNAREYGDQAAQVNLVENQSRNVGSGLLAGIAGAGTGAGIFSQLQKVVGDQNVQIGASGQSGVDANGNYVNNQNGTTTSSATGINPRVKMPAISPISVRP